MPFKSKAQQRFMFSAESKGELPKGTAERWAEHTTDIKALPEHKMNKTAAEIADAVIEKVASTRWLREFSSHPEDVMHELSRRSPTTMENLGYLFERNPTPRAESMLSATQKGLRADKQEQLSPFMDIMSAKTQGQFREISPDAMQHQIHKAREVTRKDPGLSWSEHQPDKNAPNRILNMQEWKRR
jgi:hypothetical protein